MKMDNATMELERKKNNRLKLNMTPLIDMVFLLVIFFMLTTSFNVTEVIELGFSNNDVAAASQGKEDSILISVGLDGTLSINGTKLPEKLFMNELKLKLAKDKTQKILLLADAAVSVQHTVKAMDLARIAGGVNIILLNR